MGFDAKEYALAAVKGGKDGFLRDVAALPDSALLESYGGAARAPINILFEICYVNRRLATRLKGQDPGPFDVKFWAMTPVEFATREKAVAEFSQTMDEFIAALEAIPADQMHAEIPTPSGHTTAFDLSLFLATHLNYHDGQLNYIQLLNGDTEMHWQD
ncbi:MAG TPA: DinB family protein [Fimbriimonadaceae bacterium]|nr:DinB family protein [Fimbriimonadaceae bacterium]